MFSRKATAESPYWSSLGNWTHSYYQTSYQQAELMKGIEPLRGLWNKASAPPKTTVEVIWSSAEAARSRYAEVPHLQGWDLAQIREGTSRESTVANSQYDNPFRRKFTSMNVGVGQPPIAHQSVEDQRQYVVREHERKHREQISAYEKLANETAARLIGRAEPERMHSRFDHVRDPQGYPDDSSLRAGSASPLDASNPSGYELPATDPRHQELNATKRPSAIGSISVATPSRAAGSIANSDDQSPTYYPDAVVARALTSALPLGQSLEVENLACKSIRLCEPASAPAAAVSQPVYPPLPDYEYYASQAERYRTAEPRLRNSGTVFSTPSSPNRDAVRHQKMLGLVDSDGLSYFFRKPKLGFGGHIPRTAPGLCSEAAYHNNPSRSTASLLATRAEEYKKPLYGRHDHFSRSFQPIKRDEGSPSSHKHSVLRILKMYRCAELDAAASQ